MLNLEQVSKKIKNKKLVEGLSLHVQPGSFYALVGEAGAGKSTVLRLCAGLIKADEGRIAINGLDMRQRENRHIRSRLIGYMGQQDGYYPRLHTMEYLEVYAHACGMTGLSARERCMEVLELAGLEKRANQPLEELPAGTRRELSLLRAILHKPKLLLMDQPFRGLELSQKASMEELLADLSMDGTTILMTSQSLSELPEICGEIAVMRQGHIVSQGEISRVLAKVRNTAPLYIRVCDQVQKAVEILRKEPQVRTISRDGLHIMIRFDGDEQAEALLLSKLEAGGVLVYSFFRAASSLEDLPDQE